MNKKNNYNLKWRLNNTDRAIGQIYWELVFRIIAIPSEIEAAIHESCAIISFNNQNNIESWRMCISNKPNPPQPKKMPWWNKTLIHCPDYNIRAVHKIINGQNAIRSKKEFGQHLKNIFINSDSVDRDGIIRIGNIVEIKLF